jgi:hypothetical protein
MKKQTTNEKMQWEGWVVAHMKRRWKERTITTRKRWWEGQTMQMRRSDKENEQ